eukprot:6189431-Pleurochrysis_carterae.AAC.2
MAVPPQFNTFGLLDLEHNVYYYCFLLVLLIDQILTVPQQAQLKAQGSSYALSSTTTACNHRRAWLQTHLLSSLDDGKAVSNGLERISPVRSSRAQARASRVSETLWTGANWLARLRASQRIRGGEGSTDARGRETLPWLPKPVITLTARKGAHSAGREHADQLLVHQDEERKKQNSLFSTGWCLGTEN